MPLTREPTTGRPRASASVTTRERPSEREGSTSSVAASIASIRGAVASRFVQVTRTWEAFDELRDGRRARAHPDDVQRRLRHYGGDELPRLPQDIDVLVRLEHADVDRGGGSGQRLRRAGEEWLEVGEAGENVDDVDAELADELGCPSSRLLAPRLPVGSRHARAGRRLARRGGARSFCRLASRRANLRAPQRGSWRRWGRADARAGPLRPRRGSARSRAPAQTCARTARAAERAWRRRVRRRGSSAGTGRQVRSARRRSAPRPARSQACDSRAPA